ncbi:MAG: archease [Aigarchaeota archaeon]|nr:archease [Aigarchaeota archaeon]MDW8092380.1 archease [Nitrososphaerota archaeon]
MGEFRFLEHPSDVYVEARGSDLKEALSEAGRALFAVIVRNFNDVRPLSSRDVSASGYDELSLLYDWLERLLLLFELEQFVASRIDVDGITRSTDSLNVTARVYGETFDRARHVPGVYVKSPTYWLMEVVERDNETYLRYVLDI